MGTAAVTQMPARATGRYGWPLELSGIYLARGLGSDAHGPWLLVGPDALAASHFRPLGPGLGLGNQCCVFRAKPPIPLSGLSGLQRSLGRQHSGCQNKPPP